jgi:hypothetical protein
VVPAKATSLHFMSLKVVCGYLEPHGDPKGSVKLVRAPPRVVAISLGTHGASSLSGTIPALKPGGPPATMNAP